MPMVLLTVRWSSVTPLTLSSADLRTESDSSRKLSDASVFLITLSPIPTTFLPSKSSSLRDSSSARMVIIGFNLDIYIMMVSAVHCVSKKDTYIAIISTTVETNEPEKEIEVAFDLIGNIREKFTRITERYEPIKNYGDGVFISNSFDATSHFESETENVLNLYKQISGKDLDLTNLPEDADD